MKIGYARVSTADQNLDSQVDELKEDGCEKIFTDIVSGAKSERPGLAALKAHIRIGFISGLIKGELLSASIFKSSISMQRFFFAL